MEVIHQPFPEGTPAGRCVKVPVERLTLAKRRWRGIAEDGREFGFDLDAPLSDGAVVFVEQGSVYVITQKYEPVIEVPLALSPPAAARLGWLIGNLHFSMEVAGEVVRVADDSALRQMLDREGLSFTPCKRVFHPFSRGHQH